jgi:hypothetical protein
MMPPDLRSAAGSFAVSNTPLFLASRLRNDPAVAQIAKWPSNDIMKALRGALRVRPTTIERSVAPYVYIVALSVKEDIHALRAASSFNGQNAMWYSDICNFLVHTARPTTYVAAAAAVPTVATSPQAMISKVPTSMSSFAARPS